MPYKISQIPSTALAVLVAAASLAGCAMPGQQGGGQESQAMPGAAQSGGGMMGSGTMSGGQSGGAMTGTPGTQRGMTPANKEAMCGMYRSIQGAPSQQERQMIMDQGMQGMTPDMRQQEMERMRRQCE